MIKSIVRVIFIGLIVGAVLGIAGTWGYEAGYKSGYDTAETEFARILPIVCMMWSGRSLVCPLGTKGIEHVREED